MTTAMETLEQRLRQQIATKVVGMDAVVRAVAIAVIARGHILVQGAPGLGKTLLAKTLAATLGGTFKRIQGTADLMPSDITGVYIYDQAQSTFTFRPGPVFADVVLVDEINRASPKTQSSLLEAMEERQVTIDREQFPLPEEFMVIATQNPREFEGTFPLPESQLDRFMLCVDVAYPDRDMESGILSRYGMLQPASVPAAVGDVVTAEQLLASRMEADRIHVAPELSGYIIDIARSSREHPLVTLGLSTRGSLALLRAARVHAGLLGSDFVSPDDVKAVVPLVVPHRLVLAPEALLEGTTASSVAATIVERVVVPR